ncbi:hypothetical protein JC1_42 [Burkholderia phage JC1]|nr:hypothetical protein JC1_42 [Burkholderia phage JC1]
MKRVLDLFFLLGLAIGLTILVFIGLTNIDPLLAWLHSNAGYAVLEPLFRASGADGVERHEEVIGAVLIAASFLISCALIWATSRLVSRSRGSA